MDILRIPIVLIVLTIVVAIVWWFVANYAIPLIRKMPEPFRSIVVFLLVAILVIVLVLILLGLIGIGPGVSLGIRL